MNEDIRIALKRKGYQRNADGSYSLATLVAGTQASQPEPSFRDEPLGKSEVQNRTQERTHIRFLQFTQRRCDPDNCCGKFHTDWLRQKRIISDDTDDDVTITVRQIQVATAEEEGVLIEVL